VPCMRMKELEASCSRFAERRLKTIAPKSERRLVFSIKRRIRLALMSYLMQTHLHSCVEPAAPFDLLISGADNKRMRLFVLPLRLLLVQSN
jgi:hypothetical protein